MKKLFCIFITIIVLALSGCSKSVTVSDMPDIVFMKFTKYYRGIPFNESSDDGKYSIEFLDKNGDFYITYSYEMCTLYENELIEKFKSGDDRIEKLPKSRDVGEILTNYKKLLKVSSNKKYGLEYVSYMVNCMD